MSNDSVEQRLAKLEQENAALKRGIRERQPESDNSFFEKVKAAGQVDHSALPSTVAQIRPLSEIQQETEENDYLRALRKLGGKPDRPDIAQIVTIAQQFGAPTERVQILLKEAARKLERARKERTKERRY